jgi:integrase
LALTWGDIGERTISITKAIALGEVGDTKTRTDRVVPLLGPLRSTLEAFVMQGDRYPLVEEAKLEMGRWKDSDDELIFDRDGPWQDHDWRNWRKRVWQPTCAKIGIAKLTLSPRSYVGPRPYDLRHSAASLQLAAGTNPLEVADMLGHGPQILLSTYAHVIAELKGQPPAGVALFCFARVDYLPVRTELITRVDSASGEAARLAPCPVA